MPAPDDVYSWRGQELRSTDDEKLGTIEELSQREEAELYRHYGLRYSESQAGGGAPEGNATVGEHRSHDEADKRVVPKERVRLDKDLKTDEREVSETVRKEQLDIEGDAARR